MTITPSEQLQQLTNMHLDADFRGGVEMSVGEFYACTDWLTGQLEARRYRGTAELRGVITVNDDGQPAIRASLSGRAPIVDDWQILAEVPSPDTPGISRVNPGLTCGDVSAIRALGDSDCSRCGAAPERLLAVRHSVVGLMQLVCCGCAGRPNAHSSLWLGEDPALSMVSPVADREMFTQFLPSLRNPDGSSRVEHWPVRWVVGLAVGTLSVYPTAVDFARLAGRVKRRLRSHDYPDSGDLCNADCTIEDLYAMGLRDDVDNAISAPNASPSAFEALCWAVGIHSQS